MKMHKFTNNSILNRSNTSNLTNLGGVYPKFKANLCISLRGVTMGYYIVTNSNKQ